MEQNIAVPVATTNRIAPLEPTAKSKRIAAMDIIRGTALFGPLEWLWRSLTYWKVQPMRRETGMPEAQTTVN